MSESANEWSSNGSGSLAKAFSRLFSVSYWYRQPGTDYEVKSAPGI